MVEVGRFSQRISLEGLEEIKKGLQEIGLTGTKAFKEVDKAIAVANKELTGFAAAAAATQAAFVGFGTGLTRVGAATATLGTSLGALGSTLGSLASRFAAVSGIGLALSIGGATAAVIAFIKASAEAGEEVLETSQSLGLSVEAYQRLAFAAEQSGLSQEQFARGFSNFNKLIVDGAKDQQKALLSFATNVKSSLGSAGQTVEESLAKIGPTFQQLTENAKTLQQQLEFRGITGIPLAVITEHLRKLATGSAEARKEYVALTSGLGAPLNLTALEKFGVATETAGNALQRLGIRLVDPLTGQARNAEEVLGDLAEAFTKIPNETERAALALQVFQTRGIGRKFIPLLIEGRAGLEKLKDEFSEFITGFDRPGAIAADKVTDAFSALFGTIRNLRNQLAVPLFGPLEAAAKAVQRVLFANKKAFEELGVAIAARVVPVIQDFVRLIAGQPVAADSFVGRLRDGFVAFGNAVSIVVFGVVVPALKGLLAILGQVADAINAVFGTKLTGGELLGIGLLTLAFGGLVVAIGNVGLAVAGLALALTRLAAHPVILTITLFVAAVATLGALFQDVTRKASPFQKKMQEINEELLRTRNFEKYNQQMRELTAAQKTSGETSTDNTAKIAALTLEMAKGGPAAAEAARQLRELTGATTAVGTASQNTGIAVREVGAAATATGIQVRAAGAATTQSTLAVREAAIATQQATTQAATGLANVETEATEVEAATADIGIAATQAMNPLEALGRVLLTGTISQFQQMLLVIDELIRKSGEAREAVSKVGENAPALARGGGFARGGFVRGPGTATSDSILARLSSGEFVIRAAAVKHFGAQFFAALNALRTPRLNMGGLVEGLNRNLARNFAVPGFAMGGPATGSTARGDLRPVVINIGGRQIAGLFAPPDVVQELRRAAISEQYLSAGRKA